MSQLFAKMYPRKCNLIYCTCSIIFCHLYPNFCILAPTIRVLQGRKALFPQISHLLHGHSLSVLGASAPRPIWLGQPDCQVLKHPAGGKLGIVPEASKFYCAIDRSSHPQATYQISAQSINWLKSYYYLASPL